MNTQSNQNQYFNVITKGLGYFNDLRMIDPKQYGGKGDQYLSVRIAGLNGPDNDVEYLRFDTNVVGSKAIEILNGPVKDALLKADSSGRTPDDVKILGGFSLGDVKPRLFVYNSGDKKGETGVSMQGRLLGISYLKIDDEIIDLTAFNGEVNTDNDEASASEAPVQQHQQAAQDAFLGKPE